MTLRGVKPLGAMQPMFESFYLYGAVEPASGESLLLEFSHLDPEVNPIEGVWQYLEDKLAGALFSDLSALREEVYQRL